MVMPGELEEPGGPSKTSAEAELYWWCSLSRSFSAGEERRETDVLKNWEGKEEEHAAKGGEEREKREHDQWSEEDEGEEAVLRGCRFDSWPSLLQYFFSQDRGRDLRKRQVITSRCINTLTPTRPDRPRDEAEEEGGEEKDGLVMLQWGLEAPAVCKVPLVTSSSILSVSKQ